MLRQANNRQLKKPGGGELRRGGEGFREPSEKENGFFEGFPGRFFCYLPTSSQRDYAQVAKDLNDTEIVEPRLKQATIRTLLRHY